MRNDHITNFEKKKKRIKKLVYKEHPVKYHIKDYNLDGWHKQFNSIRKQNVNMALSLLLFFVYSVDCTQKLKCHWQKDKGESHTQLYIGC